MRGGRGGVYNLVVGDQFVNPGTNPAFQAGKLSMWKGLQGSEDMDAAITASDVDMEALDRRNAHANQIV